MPPAARGVAEYEVGAAVADEARKIGPSLLAKCGEVRPRAPSAWPGQPRPHRQWSGFARRYAVTVWQKASPSPTPFGRQVGATGPALGSQLANYLEQEGVRARRQLERLCDADVAHLRGRNVA